MNVQAAPAGFRDPVLEAQTIFHAVMMAMARPGTIEGLPMSLLPPPPLTAGLAAVALALCDHETPVWLDPTLSSAAEVSSFVRFHTGASIVSEPAKAGFALIADIAGTPPLAAFAQGSDEYPDRSSTVVFAVTDLTAGSGLTLRGPGIKGTAGLAIDPMPGNLVADLAANRARFPRGVDCIFVAPGKVAALPRSTRIVEG